MFEVDCIPVREVFYNPENGYRVVSCYPDADKFYPELDLTAYGNFTINGCNLDDIKLDTPYSFQLEPSVGKYKASYALVGLVGINMVNGKIEVNPEYELKLLRGFMTPSQAKRVNKAYPNFIQLVLNDKADEIDVKQIENVGKIRFHDYQMKIKKSCRQILISCEAMKYGITRPSDLNNLAKIFETAQDFAKGMHTDPYKVLIDMAGWSFTRADKRILEFERKLIYSYTRCLYACKEVLRRNAEYGNTRMTDSQLAFEANDLAPECSRHIFDVVTTDKQIFYSKELRKVSLDSDYRHEVSIATDLIKRLKSSYKTKLDATKFYRLDDYELTDEQRLIIDLAENYSVSILTGMAGCGKSFCTKALVLALEDACQSYKLLAPTGIAAKRLSEATGREASTIHMYLSQLGGLKDCGIDFYIIDETSMVGIGLMDDLLKQIDENAKLVFIGDNAQLVSISNGNLFQDMLDSGVIPSARLTKVFRYGIGGIATTSTDIRYGKDIDYAKEYPDMKFIPIDINHYIAQVTDEYRAMLDAGYNREDIKILCPFNKDPVGSFAINDAIQQAFNPNDMLPVSVEIDGHTVGFKIGDLVLNTVNEYRMPAVSSYARDEDVNFLTIGVMNGDVGTIVGYEPPDEGTHSSYKLYIQFDSGVAIYERDSVSNLRLGYCISIHKSQGCEASGVIIVIDSCHKHMLSRNLEYVAVSRAKKFLTIISNPVILNAGVEYQENLSRDTWLKEKLMEGNESICDTL